VLDVGCSSGAFLFQVRKHWPADYQILGTDVSGPPLDYAESRGVPVVRGEFLKQDFGAQTFDAITFWAVVEHLCEPKPFLEKAAGILNSGGYCFILVPNLESLAVRLLGRKYRYILPQHVNYFSIATLRHLVESQPGFRIVATASTHFNPLVIVQDWRQAGRLVRDEDRAKLLQRTTRYKRKLALRPLRWALGGLERLLGRLNLADNLVIVLQWQAR
jgi:ubiquinone/menaquinone biosynthesis C-methylase UbiE